MSLRITIDAEACSGHGLCYSLAPALVDADECGRGVVVLEEVPVDLEGVARTAQQNCPELAIRLDRS